MTKSRSVTPVLERAADKEARRLASLLHDDDGDSRSRTLLGWFFWYRAQAGRGRRMVQDRDNALVLFLGAFLLDAPVDELPEEVLAAVADQAMPLGDQLFDQVQAVPDPEAIIALVALRERILAATPAGDRLRGIRVSHLGVALRTRFERTGSLDDLTAAIDHLRRAIPLVQDPVHRAWAQSNLGVALQMLFGQTDRIADLTEAIDLATEAIDAVPAQDFNGPGWQSNLGLALLQRFEHTGAPEDMERAVDVCQDAMLSTPADHPGRPLFAANLATCLRARFQWTADPADLEEAIRLWRQVIAIAPAGTFNRTKWQASLGTALQARFDHGGEPSDLDEAIRLLRESAAGAFPDHPGRLVPLVGLSEALRLRFRYRRDLADLDEALRVLREALASVPSDGAGRALLDSQLGNALRTRFEWSEAPEDLNEAIDHLTRAVAAAPKRSPERAAWLSNLGVALRTRYERIADLDSLTAAIQVSRDAVAILPTGHPDRPPMASNLGVVLVLMAERGRTQGDLDEAIALHAEAARNARHPERAAFLSNLGTAHSVMFSATGRLEHLNAAIDAFQQAVTLARHEHPERPAWQSNLGSALGNRFERTGNLADLDEAVARHREAVAATPADDPRRGPHLSNLALTLRSRFRRNGARDDLDAAVRAGRRAVAAVADDHPLRYRFLLGLTGCLQLRFDRTGDLADLEGALRTAREALSVVPADHPDRADCLSSLATVLRDLAEQSPSDPRYLDEAVTVGRQSLAMRPHGHPDWALLASNLAAALKTRAERTGHAADLDEAIELLELAVERVPDDDPSRAGWLTNLGTALHARFETTGSAADLDTAATRLAQAADNPGVAPSVRVMAARMAGGILAESRPSLAAGYFERVVRMLPEVATRRLTRDDRQFVLGGLAEVASDAAALTLADPARPEDERASLALRLLEAGRAVLLGQALETRSDLTDLAIREPDLATRFVRLRMLLDEPPETTEGRRRVSAEFTDVLDRIRALDGFASFGRPPSLNELVAQAAEGPIAVLNVSRYRCDALMLTASGVTALPLPDMTYDEIGHQVIAFLRGLETAVAGTTARERSSAQQRMSQVLQWLWDVAAGPVLDALGHTNPPVPGSPWPRVWWIPGGLLGLLPLHAAGYHTADGNRTVLDRVLSSYTPTVAALRHARRPAEGAADRPALVVAMPTTPGLPGGGRLHHVSAESQAVAGRLPEPVTLTEPDGSPAADGVPTRAAVLRHLTTCPIVHFACHGTEDPVDPSNSRLLLHDHETAPLTVTALAPLHLGHARLAYLSACETALTTNLDLIDEAIHLASAFQIAGYRHVIGTLWKVNDARSAHIATTFYSRLTDGLNGSALDPSRAAHALHEAVRLQRDAVPGTPSLWAAHIHTGA
ncbi:CHAT domain-containing protein [Actinomadura sp. KC216]|uniref:CHAT domain-containing tetratricopeptide repeat protein n=1 Tax=Actinomadura sp. KC216 TaxID=2530370 RepID=UPI00104BCF27|nr:CHAT domain-containing tetratricopeptide repeat protein [Actinomadura sp. KC216]TDB88973.1 CHAT domain-containing protein [Actinomadura sp. KC216]